MKNDDDTPVEEIPRDRPFNPFRISKSVNAKAVVKEIVQQVQRYEVSRQSRRRRRRSNDQHIFESTISAVILDVIHRYLTESEGWLAIPLSKQVLGKTGHYYSPVLNKTLPNILKNLASAEIGVIEMRIGHQGYFNNARRSTIRASERLISKIEDFYITLADIKVDSSQEPIILKAERTDVFRKGKPIEYEDTETTKLYREQIEKINEWLAEADIALDPRLAKEKGIDGSDRFLRRIFNNSSFEQGGRLFGGFWQELNDRERFSSIKIKKSQIVMLDYGQMAPRILYAMAKAKPAEEDLYNVPLYWGYRNGIKKIFNALIFIEKRPDRFPAETKKLFHRNTKINDVVDAIINHHSPISHLFFTKVGFTVMFIESQILVAVLLTFVKHDIVGLPIHDGIIVAKGDKDKATEIMLESFKGHTGAEGRVTAEDRC